MCKLVPITTNDGRTVMVADIKKDAILNIINEASKCPIISRVILFGSALEERCTERSDIDIAAIGVLPKKKCLNLSYINL